MKSEVLIKLFKQYQEHRLFNRYITNRHIEPLLSKFESNVLVEIIGYSVNNNPIYSIKMGSGDKKILMWSQMHGNESTTTKALFDVLNTLNSSETTAEHILNTCSLYIIPILNPDGAEAYTRVNANEVDLNRDAQALSQPESKVLRQAFDTFKPHFCYNLHGQRTIFSAGHSNHPATVSFLAPAQDELGSLTENRKVAMEVISVMNNMLQFLIPKQVGVYDDSFNRNCVGDTFQSKNVPTLLFEAGHYPNDYERDKTREFIYDSLLTSLDYISKHPADGSNYQTYFDIPQNEKLFYDIIIRNVKIDSTNEKYDIGIVYQEKLKDGKIEFVPKVEKIDKLNGFFGHKEFNANGNKVFNKDNRGLKTGHENDCVIINNEIISLLLK